MPGQLCDLFALIYSFCHPADTLSLQQNQKDSLTEDYMNLHHLSTYQAEQRALADIERLLLQNGITGTELGLPEITHQASAASVQQPVPSMDDVLTRITMKNRSNWMMLLFKLLMCMMMSMWPAKYSFSIGLEEVGRQWCTTPPSPTAHTMAYILHL